MVAPNLWITQVLFCIVVACQSIEVESGLSPPRTPSPSPGGGKQKWNYVPVRKDAFMFWWLYYSTAVEGYANKPLILWLQGGPGGSSTGFGNFQELGPLDVNLKPRNTTWLSEANLLFVDNPVGTGYSYVTSDSAYTANLAAIVKDLVTMTQAFLQDTPEFQTVPFYIFSESYGGKMAAGVAQGLHRAIQSGTVKCNLQGVAMGDSWISPVDSVDTWGPYLYATSVVDNKGLAAINKSAMATRLAVEAGHFMEATDLWSQTEGVVEAVAAGVNFYNILKWTTSGAGDDTLRYKPDHRDVHTQAVASLHQRHVAPLYADSLSQLMNGPIRKKLGIIPKNVTWGGQSSEVFEKLSEDFMKPVIDIVGDLLESTSVKVVVYNGQLDLIVDTLGTEKWIPKLKWSGLPGYKNAARKPFLTDKQRMAGFTKSYKNFSFYWVMNAGHMIPADAGDAALKMMKMIVSSS